MERLLYADERFRVLRLTYDNSKSMLIYREKNSRTNLCHVVWGSEPDEDRASLEYLSVIVEGLAGPGLQTERIPVGVLQHHVLTESIERVARTIQGVDVGITIEPTWPQTITSKQQARFIMYSNSSMSATKIQRVCDQNPRECVVFFVICFF